MNKLKLLAVLPLAAGAVMLGAQAANAAPSATISPTSGPDGTSVNVSLSGFEPGSSLAIVQCKVAQPTNPTSDCNVGAVQMVTADSSGKASGTITIDGSYCTSNKCYVGGGTVDQSASAPSQVFTLASSGGSSSSAPASSAPAAPGGSDTGAGAGSTTTDPTVNAGTGGTADREGMPAGVIALAAIGAVAVAGGAVRFARR